MNSPDFKINPFSLPPSKANLDFLSLFVQVLAEANGESRLTAEQEQDLYHQIENLFEIDADLRTLSTLANTLERGLAARLQKWTEGGQFGFLFDNAKDTLTFSRFQCFDFQGMSQYPQIVEPLLFYILHRANEVISDRKLTHVFKAFFIDEAWVFFRNPAVKNYIVEALKTWRKQNAAMVLSTQSLDELRKSGILDVIQESCPTKIFLSNPDMDRELYGQQFHLNDNEIELVSTLAPKRQMLIKNPDVAKVANLDVDPKSYWIYTNDPFDNRKRREAFDTYGFEKGLEILAGGKDETPFPRPRDRVPRARRVRPRIGAGLLVRRGDARPLLGRAVSLRPGSWLHFRFGGFRNLSPKSIFLRRSNMKRTSLVLVEFSRRSLAHWVLPRPTARAS